MSSMSAVLEESLGLLGSLDPQLACLAARGWGKMNSVAELCVGSVVEGEEVRVWAVRVMREVIENCSEAQLVQKCGQWRSVIVSALQKCSGSAALGEVSGCVSALVSKAHSTGLREFSTAHLPALLSCLLQFQAAAPCLQVAVLPAVSTIIYCYPSACKSHRPQILQWGREGLTNSDFSLSWESTRLLVVTHQSPDHWQHLLTSSLTTLTSALVHFSLTLSQTTPLPDNPDLELPESEPSRTTCLLRLITSHCRLLSHLLITPPPSPLTLSLSTLVGVVSFGLRISCKVVATATDSALLLSLLPVVYSSLLTLLTSLVTSSHSHILPFSTAIDTALLRQMTNEGGVVLRGCVSRAVCAWVRVRGEGGKGDTFVGAVIRWLLQSCHSEGPLWLSLKGLCVTMDHSSSSIQPHLLQEIWEVAVAALSRSPSTSEVTLTGVRLLKRCLEFPSPAVSLSTTTRVLHHLTLSPSSEVQEESKQGLAICTLLLHPTGPPWGSNSDPISGGHPANSSPIEVMGAHRLLRPITSHTPQWPEFSAGPRPPRTEISTESVLQDSRGSVGEGGKRKRRRKEQEDEIDSLRAATAMESAVDAASSGAKCVHQAVEEQEAVGGRAGGVGMGEGGQSGVGEDEGQEKAESVSESTRKRTKVLPTTDSEKSVSMKRQSAHSSTVIHSGMGSQGEDMMVEGEGEKGELTVSNGSDVEDIIATFCSSPSHSDSEHSN